MACSHHYSVMLYCLTRPCTNADTHRHMIILLVCALFRQGVRVRDRDGARAEGAGGRVGLTHA